MSGAWPCALWLVCGPIVGVLLNRLLCRSGRGLVRHLGILSIITAISLLAILTPIVSAMEWWHGESVDVETLFGLILPGFFWGAMLAVPAAAFLSLLPGWWASMRQSPLSPDSAHRLRVAWAGGAFVSVYALTAYLGVGMALTG